MNKRKKQKVYIYMYIYTIIYNIHMSLCVCLHMCVCMCACMCVCNKKKTVVSQMALFLTGTISVPDYHDDLKLLLNIPAQAEFMLHSLKQTAVGTGLYINFYKKEIVSFK